MHVTLLLIFSAHREWQSTRVTAIWKQKSCETDYFPSEHRYKQCVKSLKTTIAAARKKITAHNSNSINHCFFFQSTPKWEYVFQTASKCNRTRWISVKLVFNLLEGLGGGSSVEIIIRFRDYLTCSDDWRTALRRRRRSGIGLPRRTFAQEHGDGGVKKRLHVDVAVYGTSRCA